MEIGNESETQIVFRVSEKEKNLLKERAKKNDLNISQFVRKKTFGENSDIHFFENDIKELHVEMQKIANELHQKSILLHHEIEKRISENANLVNKEFKNLNQKIDEVKTITKFASDAIFRIWFTVRSTYYILVALSNKFFKEEKLPTNLLITPTKGEEFVTIQTQKLEKQLVERSELASAEFSISQ